MPKLKTKIRQEVEIQIKPKLYIDICAVFHCGSFFKQLVLVLRA